jgi:hypothetical protein
MNSLLWVLAVVGAINTAGVVWCAVRGDMPSATPTSRALDAIYTAGVGAWALWLLAKAA